MKHKQTHLWVVVGLLLLAATASAAVPVLSNLNVVQRPGSRIVDITYELAGGNSEVVAEYQTDAAWLPIPETGLSGDFGPNVAPGTDRAIEWDISELFAGQPAVDVKVRLVADGGITVVLPGGLVMEFVKIPAGSYQRGSPDAEPGRFANEGPQHTVTISQPYYMGKFEVTQGQWLSVTEDPFIVQNCGLFSFFNPSHHWGDCDRPLESVTWDDITSGIGLLVRLNGYAFLAGLNVAFDLPTEAQWEYACRAGTDSAFNNGTTLTNTGSGTDPNLEDIAWYSANSGVGQPPSTVGGKDANAWGLHDMHGNVSEWCLDYFGDYAADPLVDPTGPASGTTRVIRGGASTDNAASCRSAFRFGVTPTIRNSSIGCRLVANGVPDTDAEETAQFTLQGTDFTVLEDADDSTVDLASYFTLAGFTGDVTYNITDNSNPALFSQALIQGEPESLFLSYAENMTGSATFTIHAIDELLVEANATLTVTVSPVNDPPTNSGIGDETEDEDGDDIVIDLSVFDDLEDGDSDFNFAITMNSQPGLFADAVFDTEASTLTLSLAANQHGSSTLEVTATDSGLLSSTASFTVMVNPINDLPVNTEAPAVTGTVHVGNQLAADIGTWNDDADLTPGNLTYSYQWQVADDMAGTNVADIPGAVAASYTPGVADNLRWLRVQVTASDDGEGLPASQSTTVASAYVEVANAAPVFASGGDVDVEMDEDASPVAFDLTLDATDPDGDGISWSITAEPQHGDASLSGARVSQAFDYTPDPEYNGPDSFDVTATDSLGAATTITVNINVRSRNDLPVNTALPNITGVLLPGFTLTATDGAWNDDKDDPPAPLLFSRQWQRADDAQGSNLEDIPAATDTTYLLTDDDMQRWIRVRVRVTEDTEEGGFQDAFSVFLNVGWLVEMAVTGATPAELALGMLGRATDGVDPEHDVVAAGDPLVAGNTALRQPIGDFEIDVRDLSDSAEWLLIATPDTTDVTFTWTGARLPSERFLSMFEVTGPDDDTPVGSGAHDLSLAGQLTVPAGGTRYYRIRYADEATEIFSLVTGWNLFSLPVEPDDPDPAAVFADGEGGVVYGGVVWQYNDGFLTPAEELEVGNGYWMYLHQDAIVRVDGIIPALVISLNEKWNLIGVTKTMPLPDNADLIGPAWSWDGTRFLPNETLHRRIGYWVNSEDEAEIQVD